jgi:hypothetical protein
VPYTTTDGNGTNGGTMAVSAAWPGMKARPSGAKCADAVTTIIAVSPWAAARHGAVHLPDPAVERIETAIVTSYAKRQAQERR